LKLTDVSGKIVKEVGMITGESYLLKKDQLVPGMYIIELVGTENYRGLISIGR
jgi:hypothetical protein